MKRHGILLLALGLAVVAPSVSIGAASKPNIVFVLADDLGWRDVGCFGSTFHETPSIDSLAKRGMKLTQAYAASPLCSPTRASIMTGLYPARIGITAPACHVAQVQLEKRLAADRGGSQKVLIADSLTRLKTEYFTLAEALREAGYATAHFGKWHLGHNRPKEPKDKYEPSDQGFDVDFPHTPSAPGPGGGYLAPWKFVKDAAVKGEAGEHIDERLAVEAGKFIKSHKDRPFFINFWTYSVHSPWNARRDYIDYFKPKADPKNPQHNPLYAAMVRSLDDSVGRLLRALEEAGVAEHTIIVFFSDNGGWAYPPKSTDPAGFEDMPATSNYPLRSGKASLFEGGTREPCIVVWPGRVRPGSSSDALFSSVDWYPTLLSMAGLKPRTGLKLDGVDQTSVLLGGSSLRDRAFCHFPHGSPRQAANIPGFLPGTWVRKGDWKLIRFFADNENGSDRFDLYNLREDPGETTNLAQQRPERVAEMNELISGFLQETEAVVPMRNPAYKPGAPKEPVANATADPLQGWKARQCRAEVRNGIMTVNGSAGAFLGVGAGGNGPAVVKLRARCARGGEGKVEWIPPQREKSSSISFKISGGDWETIEVDVPARGPLGILRVYLPADGQSVDLDWIELQLKPKPRRWDF